MPRTIRARRCSPCAESYRAGDTDLAWTRLTLWRAQLAAVFDQLDPSEVTGVTVKGAVDSPSTVLLAAWLTLCLDVPVTIASAPEGTGVRSVRFTRERGDVELSRPVGDVAELYQPGPEAPADFAAAAPAGRLPGRGNAPARPGRGLRRGRARGPEAHQPEEHPSK